MFVLPCEAIVPPVANIVTFGREALIGVWMSWRTNSLCSCDRVRSTGDAIAKDVSNGTSCTKAFIFSNQVEAMNTISGYSNSALSRRLIYSYTLSLQQIHLSPPSSANLRHAYLDDMLILGSVRCLCFPTLSKLCFRYSYLIGEA